MVVNENEIRNALLERQRREGLQPLEQRELNNAVSEMVPYALMLDEVGRIALLDAFKYGQIDMGEFKRRAYRNEPDGKYQQRSKPIHPLGKQLNELTLSY